MPEVVVFMFFFRTTFMTGFLVPKNIAGHGKMTPPPVAIACSRSYTRSSLDESRTVILHCHLRSL
jgi:hypothetical protein